jgi:hypothetical protein
LGAKCLIYDKANANNPSAYDIRMSFSDDETVGAVASQPLLHYASSVTCSDLAAVVDNL